MQINIKSNRSFIIKIILPSVVFIGVFILFMAILFFINYELMKNNVATLLSLIAFELVMISFILIAKFYDGKNYKFNEAMIEIYNKRKLLSQINLGDIDSILYISFKWHYIITVFAGALIEGGCWKLHINFKDGSKTSLAFFSIKDIKKLKVLYPILITIL